MSLDEKLIQAKKNKIKMDELEIDFERLQEFKAIPPNQIEPGDSIVLGGMEFKVNGSVFNTKEGRFTIYFGPRNERIDCGPSNVYFLVKKAVKKKTLK